MAASETSPEAPPLPRRKKFIPKYEVEGVHKVILTEDTQTLIGMFVGTDIIAQYPWKMVPKERIMDSIDLSHENSEFYHLKADLEAYEDEEILMGYIVDDSRNNDEFYICVTLEARDHCQEQSDRFIRRQEKKLEKAIQKKPRPWVSLGSELELTELIPINTRSLIEVEIKSKFPTTYDPAMFSVRDTHSVRDGCIELTPYREKYNLVNRRRIDTETQAAASKCDREAQTELRYPQNMWTQSIADALGSVTEDEAGGDTAKIDDEIVDKEDDGSSSEDEAKPQVDEVGIVAYKSALKRIRRPSHMKLLNEFISSNVNEMDNVIELNTVMDIYRNDYLLLSNEENNSLFDTMAFEEYICFTDVRAKDKYISSTVFHPMWAGIVAISYADACPAIMKYSGTRPNPIQRAVYGLNPVMIWSHTDSLLPKLYLEAPREVKVLSFCPFDENILIGGCVNGQLVIWDLKNKLDMVENFEILSERREKYRIAMSAHMAWIKPVHETNVVPATAVSSLITSHYGPITDIQWLSPNFNVTPTGKVVISPNGEKNMTVLTGSEDGTILIWNLSLDNVIMSTESKKVKKSKRVLVKPAGLTTDVSPYKVLDRNLQPHFKVILGIAGSPDILPLQSFALNKPEIKYIHVPSKKGTGRKYFECEVLSQTEEDISRTLYCGSVHGELRRITWAGHDFNTGEVVNAEFADIDYSCKLHDGVITTVIKSPFVDHVTLTVGGKIFAIWSDKLLGRPLIWKKRPYLLTDADWSVYKPSIIFLTTVEGTLEVWDLFLRSDQPISVQTLSGAALTGIISHTLPLTKNITGVSDVNGSFKLCFNPQIFMLNKTSYLGRLEHMINRELNVMQSFIAWQDNWLETNPHILLEIKQKEALLLAEKEAEKLLLREQEEKRIEDAAEAKRLEKLKVVGPEEKWQQIIQKLIERTIAVKKRINRAELIEQEKPLRDLEAQRLEKERRMHDIMKNQKNIFNDTVAILFPEAIKKKEKPKKTYLVDDKDKLKRDYLETYSILKSDALQTVHNNPYVVEFSWEATLAEGKDRREALTASNEIIKIHKTRIEIDGGISLNEQSLQSVKDDGSLYGEDVQEQDVISNEIKVEKETSELKDVEKKSKKGKGVKVKLDKVKTKKVESELIKDEQMDAETKEEPTLL